MTSLYASVETECFLYLQTMTTTFIFSRIISANMRQTIRKIHSSSIICKSAYEGDGKTTISILNRDEVYGLMINSYSKIGFRLNNGISIIGSLAIFPRSVLSWKVNTIDDVNEETLSLFTILDPKPDILVIGTGDPHSNIKVDKKLALFAKKFKMNMEIVPTCQACPIFNFLNAEGRFVAAALIPPANLDFNANDSIQDPMGPKALENSTNL
ncbi:NADH dehydrogenase [ubiquinone] 1 alpha subcomplex assembly factor 3 [Neodiprion pinetum]|uniref:NADH dehydrogenase [ubiquinone] 1 alpha subcomplex assembly factor 3 n=1 Tax=Neodiprion lecontei TaxID=441921 RepID=A0A6J0C020_NEOLC|nr:NADH dehydrogenase [ubiquinone] 1 alpha subcomplex assembly factor 3 [Neodiprion lecontei]XP_046478512.1 NADH dehydrogenase [ubiquinone] 1 alpha subcomplex assembly factor 3 [Neodiprion pinetum]